MDKQQLRPDTLLQGGKYKIVRFISAGGFGCTYEGVHVLLKKRVAIKEFFVKDFCNRDENTSAVSVGITSKTALVNKLKTKFVDEAQFVSTLKHPNIVNVYDVFEENGTAYYVMDYIDGPSLNDMVKQHGAMNQTQAVAYIRQVAEALKYVHDHNRLHLDVKPGNVMIDENDNAILIDFGASKQYDEEAGENTSTLLGKTPGYAPLEQMGNDVVKFMPSTDIYALGATLYKLLTGVTPPSANLLASGEEIEPLPSSVSASVRNAIAQAMQLNKMKRPQTIDEFVTLLSTQPTVEAPKQPATKDDDDKTIVAGSKVEQPAPKKTAAPKKPVASSPKPTANETTTQITDEQSYVKIGVIAAIVACVVVLGGYFAFFNNSDTEPTPQPIEEGMAKEQVTGATFTDASGKEFTYSGEVVDGKPNGKGMGVYGYGNYVGDYKDGLRQGEGKFESKDGSNKFEGTFTDDKYDTGRLTMSDGYYFEGKYKDGQPYTGKWYDKNGNVESEMKNGE